MHACWAWASAGVGGVGFCPSAGPSGYCGEQTNYLGNFGTI